MKSRKQVDKSGFPGAAGPHESNHFTAARAKMNAFEHAGRIVFVGEAHVPKNNFARKRRKRLGARLLALLFFPVEISKHLRAGALRELKLLIHLADALQGHVGVEHGKKKGHKNSRRHGTVLYLI